MRPVHFYIIVVSRNSGDKLKLTLNNIYAQDYTDYEVIIEDGASDDGSVDAIKEICRENTRIFSEPDDGIYDGMNRALSRISAPDTDRYEYIIFLNCGDTFHDRQVLGIVADTAMDEALGQAAYDGSNDSMVLRAEAPHIYYGDQYNVLTASIVSSARRLNEFALFRNVPCHQVCFYDRRLFLDRGYDTQYRVRADYEHFLYCIYRCGADAEYIDHIISDYEGGGFSETEENRRISATEHRRITDMYMGNRVYRYRLIMKLTLAGLRTRISQDKRTAGIYNAIKTVVYSRKKGL